MKKEKQSLIATIWNKKGQPLSVGYNNYTKSHPLQAFFASKVGLKEKIYLHAEIDALIKCKNIKRAHKITILRHNKQGKPLLAKPCPVCEEAIKFFKIKEVEWSTT